MSAIRHVPFLKALASAKGSNDPIWRDASTGFLVLRFFDRWLEDGPTVMSADPGLAALRARLRSSEDVEPHVRHLLLTAVNALIDAETTDPAPVSAPLLAYGAYLESIGRIGLAAHVYHTVATAMDENYRSDPMSTASALVQHGYAARRVGEFHAAAASYTRAIDIANKIHEPAIAFRAQTGLANIAKARGDLDSAEILLDRTVIGADTALSTGTYTTAERESLAQASCLARQTRGAVRQARGRFVEAIQDLFTALQMAFDRTQYEAILSDLAGCAAEAGYRTLARDAYAALAKSAQSALIRSTALVNLLELTVLDHDQAGFAKTRDEIERFANSDSGMLAEHAAYAALYRAYGVERFESRDAALAAYRDAATYAKSSGIRDIESLAEQRLATLGAASGPLGLPLTGPPAQELPDVLLDAARTIADLTLAQT